MVVVPLRPRSTVMLTWPISSGAIDTETRCPTPRPCAIATTAGRICCAAEGEGAEPAEAGWVAMLLVDWACEAGAATLEAMLPAASAGAVAGSDGDADALCCRAGWAAANGAPSPSPPGVWPPGPSPAGLRHAAPDTAAVTAATGTCLA